MAKFPSTHVAVVTGSARGIGLGIAEWFLAAGGRVALWDIDGETLGRTEKRLNDPERVLAVDGGFEATGVGLPTLRKSTEPGT